MHIWYFIRLQAYLWVGFIKPWKYKKMEFFINPYNEILTNVRSSFIFNLNSIIKLEK